MNHYVYEIINNINGIKYIGKRSCDCEVEKDWYMGGGTKLKEAKDEFGIHNFSKNILAIAFDESMALDLESYYIEKVNAVESELYYNQVYGGDISHMFKHHDEEKLKNVRRIISEKNKGSNAGENSRVAKKVICLNTGEIFISCAEASKKYGLARSGVSKSCMSTINKINSLSDNYKINTASAGRHNETNEKLYWMYLDRYNELRENGDENE